MNIAQCIINKNAAIKSGKAKLRVFDWTKAAHLIKEQKPDVAEAGLAGDWEYTGGIIYEDGKPDKKSYTYLASLWAIPQIKLDGIVSKIEPINI